MLIFWGDMYRDLLFTMVSEEEYFDLLTEDWIPCNEENDYGGSIGTININTATPVVEEPEYLKRVREEFTLHILQPARFRRAYRERGNLGLFLLFLSQSWLDCVRQWTNKNLKEKGLKEVDDNKFKAYLGLEMATSIVQLNDIRSYWKRQLFTGHTDFQSTMSRDDFIQICSNLVLRDPASY